MTVAEFRARYPEFASSVTYPDVTVQEWLDTAASFLVPARWGTSLSLGIGLFTAHYLALGRQSALSEGSGAAPGVSSGMVASKSLGGASVSYESLLGQFKDAGAWALTTYGRQYWTLVRLVGMGGMQL